MTPRAITGSYRHPLELSLTGTVAMAGPAVRRTFVRGYEDGVAARRTARLPAQAG